MLRRGGDSSGVVVVVVFVRHSRKKTRMEKLCYVDWEQCMLAGP